ncbi:hypothetical protein [Methylogaea oryzae]|uniref:hypothetical protein n=1 Tax=Methylogaea oryzae TaxID=1295382 RepID=UPI0020D0F832|nr:hypothetical protein [Methylogaea oryzae]
MCGRYDRSESLIDTLIARAASDLDRAEALAEQTTSLSSIGNFIKPSRPPTGAWPISARTSPPMPRKPRRAWKS